MRRRAFSHQSGFTLIELLAVVGIMAILIALTAPAVMGLARSSGLTAGGSLLIDQLTFARQSAVAKNRLVEFRIYQLPDDLTPSATNPSFYRSFQIFVLDDKGVASALTKIANLPKGVYIINNSSVSSLLVNDQNTAAASSPYFIKGVASGKSLGSYPPASYNYVALQFKPNGSTDLNPNSALSWHASVALHHDALTPNGVPANFFTVQLNAQNGHVRSFRPN